MFPHNPVGRVWTKEELSNIANICAKHNVMIVSDEIHCDLTMPGVTHTPIASLENAADNTITLTAPTKTFNLAGLQNSNTIIKNPVLRKALKEQCEGTGYHMINTMGYVAAEAAYTHGAQWLDRLRDYLKTNVDFLDKSLKELNCGVSLIQPEATYLMWLDCRALKLNDKELEDFFTNKAKIWLNTGVSFGNGGAGFMRMNIACPRATLAKAMANLKQAVK
ncbi:bifunctional pyridoxal-dependent enzyme [Elusimicrobium simillimum]